MIQSVDRALRLLATVRDQPGVSLTDLSQHLGLLPPTASRLLATLQAHGYLTRDVDTKTYQLGPTAFALVAGPRPEVDLPTRLRPVIQGLALDAAEQASLATLDGTGVRHLLVIDGAAQTGERVVLSSQTGMVDLNLNATALGKIFLAFEPTDVTDALIDGLPMPKTARRTITEPTKLRRHLDRVRRTGYAVSINENTDEVAGVAAPVWRAGGILACALAVHGPTTRLPRARLSDLVRPVTEAAAQCSTLLGHSPGPTPSSQNAPPVDLAV